MEAAQKKILSTAGEKMDGALVHLDHEFNTVRTGTANPSLLDTIKVDAYGSEMPLNQVANVSRRDARTLLVTPWDKSQLSAVERAIMMSDIGLTPNNDGVNIILNIPPMTEERRKDMVKMAAKMAEDARIAIRQVRRHANDEVKALERDHELPEDTARDLHDQIQKLTDVHIKKVDDKFEHKQKEIMEV